MKQRTVQVVFISLSLIVIAGSCKKKSNNNPFANARIATADVTRGGAIEHYLFFYDAYNNVDSVSILGGGTAAGQAGYLKYSYIGSSWSITDENNYSFNVYANTAGMLLKILISDTLTYSYSNNQLTAINEYVATPTPPYHTITTTYLTWLNGDVVTAVTGSQSQTYTYNTSKNGQPGDGIRIKDFMSVGVSAIKTTHLLTSLTTSSTQGTSYTYTFDAEGRISTMTEVAYDKSSSVSDTSVYAYTYY